MTFQSYVRNEQWVHKMPIFMFIGLDLPKIANTIETGGLLMKYSSINYGL